MLLCKVRLQAPKKILPRDCGGWSALVFERGWAVGSVAGEVEEGKEEGERGRKRERRERKDATGEGRERVKQGGDNERGERES